MAPTMLLAGFEFQTLPQQLVLGLLIGGIYALIALGYTMVYGVLRLINFAHGEVYMLGAYTALFTSWGFYGVNKNPDHTVWYALPVMLLASMIVCAVVGVLIERFAYRPMRQQPRISSLITAIGLSLLIQYGGQLFLPCAPPPNISTRVNPYQDNLNFHITSADPKLTAEAQALGPAVDQAKTAFDQARRAEKDPLNMSPATTELRAKYFEARNQYEDKTKKAELSAMQVTVPKGWLIMFGVTLALMAILRYLVMFTKTGRAMRAVSHDFDSAALMGINVDRIVTITFMLGSALAGAGAMMSATFQSGIQINTFFGLLPGVKAFVAAVLGGIGNIPGAVLGGLLMGVAESLVVWAGADQYKDAVAFVILIVVLLFRPGGILGSSKVEKV